MTAGNEDSRDDLNIPPSWKARGQRKVAQRQSAGFGNQGSRFQNSLFRLIVHDERSREIYTNLDAWMLRALQFVKFSKADRLDLELRIRILLEYLDLPG